MASITWRRAFSSTWVCECFVMSTGSTQECNMALSNMNDHVMPRIIPHRLDIGSEGSRFPCGKAGEKTMQNSRSMLGEKDAEYQMTVFRSCLSEVTLHIKMNLHSLDEENNEPHKVIEALWIHANGSSKSLWSALHLTYEDNNLVSLVTLIALTYVN